jgi:hypothetical protein
MEGRRLQVKTIAGAARRLHARRRPGTLAALLACATLTPFAASAVAAPGPGGGLDAENLPDARVFEMVTPTANENAEAYVPASYSVSSEGSGTHAQGEENGIETRLPFQAGLDGGAVAYPGGPSSQNGGGSGVGGAGAGNQYLAIRSPAGGWSQTNLQPRGISQAVYEAFSPFLSTGILDSAKALTPGAPEADNMLYRRDNATGAYAAAFAAGPPATERFMFTFNGYANASFSDISYEGATANGRHLLFAVNSALTADSLDGGERANNLYDTVGGVSHSVNVLPDGTPQPNASFGAPAEERPSFNAPDLSNVVSGNGDRVFWSALDPAEKPTALFVRENDERPQSPIDAEGHCTVLSDACTVQVDATHGGGASGAGRFWTASADGSLVFFTDESRLTPDSTAAPGAPDLYEFNVESRALRDLTVATAAGQHADVRGVVGASSDGSYVYFVAGGALAGASAQPCRGSEPESACNLYVRHSGVTSLIASLSARDGFEGAPYGPAAGQGSHGDWQPGSANRTAQVTSDGRHLVFMSSRNLTAPGDRSEGMAEVYLYDAEAQPKLTCLSCAAGGAPPPVTEFGLTAGAAAYLPVSNSATYMQHWISEDGSRVFFDSVEPLTPGAASGVQNVYEWERHNAGGCSEPAAEAAGCLYLLSGGESSTSSWLLDASATGDDAFVITRAQLAAQDKNNAYDVYDARVGGVVQHVESPVACSGTACQGPPPPPLLEAPGSASVAGGGNLPPGTSAKPKPLTRVQKLARALRTCAKEPKRKRVSCRARARRRYGAHPKKAKRAKRTDAPARGSGR